MSVRSAASPAPAMDARTDASASSDKKEPKKDEWRKTAGLLSGASRKRKLQDELDTSTTELFKSLEKILDCAKVTKRGGGTVNTQADLDDFTIEYHTGQMIQNVRSLFKLSSDLRQLVLNDPARLNTISVHSRSEGADIVSRLTPDSKQTEPKAVWPAPCLTPLLDPKRPHAA
eukprot:TRINITY_DN21036_c0_g1_i1.p1 TRINITY_DN21036_c0_g1~~TRINITY_DN21036_c0_g1_i1.p1  ORF type:complete len:173 (-),score=4.04 TRINITY_DN21036_c0_g1_i1:124-642(-)